jgi:L-threonylcarbamoyladenylate synthase
MQQKEKFWNNRLFLQKAINALQADKLIIGTTDTVLGLFAAATQEGFDLLNKVKKRRNKPYLLIASSTGSIVPLVDLKKTFHIEKLVESFWPGPLTIIFKAKEDVPDYFLSDQKTVAIRIPDHKGMQLLLKETGLLFSTSANKAGEPIPTIMNELSPEIADQAEYLIDDEVPHHNETPSTLIDCSELTEDNPVIRVIREGKIAVAQLQEVMGTNVKIVS